MGIAQDMKRHEMKRVNIADNAEFRKFISILEKNGVGYSRHDDFENMGYEIARVHFEVNGHKCSVIHGYGSYGGWSAYERDVGLLELYVPACGNPVGFLTAERTWEAVQEITK